MSHFILEPRYFAEVVILPAYIKKSWLKVTLKYIQILINNQTFLTNDPEKGEPVTPSMDVHKAKIQSDGIIDKLQLIIVVRGDFKNKGIIGDIWSTTASMRNLNYLLADYTKHTARLHQLDFIGEFLKYSIKYRVFVKLDSRYGEYFP